MVRSNNTKRLILVLFLVYISDIFCFDNLTQAEKYSLTLEEFPAPDQNDYVNPVYKKLRGAKTNKNIRGMLPIWLNNFVDSYLLPSKLWSSNDLQTALDKAIFNRELAGNKPTYIVKFTASSKDRFVIFGPLLGSLHSFVRDLKELKKLQIIDENLNIINKNYKIIFNGNVVNGTPYILETLTLVLNLLNKNPQNVFYNAGAEEYEDAWLNSGLKDEIRNIVSTVNPDFQLLKNKFSRFFRTLPLGIFINSPEQPDDFIRISYFGRNMEKLDEENFPKLVKQKVAPGDFKFIWYSDKEKLSEKVKIDVLIKDDERLNKVSSSNGLYMMESEKGATTWASLSSPNLNYKKLYQFYYDAFIILEVKNIISQSLLKLVHQDVRLIKGFDADHTFNIISGQEISAKNIKASKKSIVVLGCTLALSKSIAAMGLGIKEGISLKEKIINKQELIPGKQLEIIFEDDAYTPDIAVSNVKKFKEYYNTNIILSPIGTPTLEACLDLIKKKEILVLFPITGADLFRNKELVNIINYRPSYTQEVKTLIKYVTSQSSGKKFAFFYQNDAYGLGPLEVAKTELSRMGLTDWVEIPYTRNEFNISSAISKIKETKPDIIALFSTGVTNSEFIRQIGTENLANKLLFTISFAADDAFKTVARSKGINIVFAHVVPNPENSELEIVQSYRENIKKMGATPSVFSLEGYITLSILEYALKKISGTADADSIRKELENIKDINLNGIELSFNPEKRELSQAIWLDVGQPEWLKFSAKDIGHVDEAPKTPVDLAPAQSEADKTKTEPKEAAPEQVTKTPEKEVSSQSKPTTNQPETKTSAPEKTVTNPEINQNIKK